MGIIIGILKTVGIILLIILAVLLLLLCMVLFVPVRYRANGEIPAKGKPHGYIRLTWLFHLISYSLEYDTGKYEKNYLSQLKICGIRFRMKQKAPKLSPSEEKAPDKNKAASEKEQEPEKEEETKKPELKELPSKEDTSGSQENTREPENGGPKGEEDKAEEQEPEKESWWERLLAAIQKTFHNIRYTITTLCDKINQIRDNIDYYLEIFAQENTQLVLKNIGGEAGRLLRHLHPRKMNVNFIVGTGDPASTGQILAVHGMLYPIFGETVHISPDFEKPRLEGDFDIRGRVRFSVAFTAVLRIILDKKTWGIVRQLKKEEMTNGRKK